MNSLSFSLFRTLVIGTLATSGLVCAALVPSGPIVVDGKSSVVIQNVKITSATGDCLVVTNATNITIRASEIGPCKGNAIRISGGSNINIYDSYIHPEGTLAGCCDRTDGIYAALVNGLTIQGNVIAYGEANIEVQRSTNIAVRGNFLLNPRNGGNRGQQFQCYDSCSGVIVDGNYTISSKDTSKYTYAASQEDAINLIGGPNGYTLNSMVRNNYVVGGFSGSGCGIISDAGITTMQILNNTLIDTGQCGIGVASGTNITVSGNKIRNTKPVPNSGNSGLYIWNQYNTPCGPVSVSNNTISAVNSAGADNSFWNGGGCGAVSLTANTFGGAAFTALTPVASQLPPPLIPPAPFSCVITSPFTTQSSAPRCDAGTDVIAPSVSVSSPQSGQMVQGTVTFIVAASDNVSVAGVQFLLNGAPVGSEIAAPPYTLPWSSSAVANGTYTLTAVARDSSGNRATSSPVTFTVNNSVVPPITSLIAPVSDDFHATALNTNRWTFVNPVGNGSYSMSGTALLLTAPYGSRHDPSDGGANNSVRVVQSVSDVDFTVEAAFTSIPTAAYQMEGILVQQDAQNYIRFEISANGSSPHLSAIAITNSIWGSKLDSVIKPVGSALWLRVRRSGSTWTLFWSPDGVNFNAAVTFAQPLSVSALGPYAGNYGVIATSTPAFTAAVDYFFNSASPITPQDGGADLIAPVIFFSSPSAGQTVSGVLTCAVSASDNIGVVGVQFLLDGRAIGPEISSPPYSIAWNSTSSANGNHTLTAVARDLAGNRTTSLPIAINVNNYVAPPIGPPVSDDFHAPTLKSDLWKFVNPVGDGSYSLTGTNLLLTAPAGKRHDPSDGGLNNSVRIMQSVSNADFTVEAKFDSLPTLMYQMEGILVQQDVSNYLRLEISSNSTSRHLSASSVIGGTWTTKFDTIIAPTGSSLWLRIQRSGSMWTLLRSQDGTIFTTAVIFYQPLTTTAVGVYAGNYGVVESATPAFTASVDYFINNASPLLIQD